jgi:hypothetical protein
VTARLTAVVLLMVPFVWLGMVFAISFVETPLKFRAPGITVPLGLGIGRLVFRALNATELALAATLSLPRSRWPRSRARPADPPSKASRRRC